jgi:hypothetical protein
VCFTETDYIGSEGRKRGIKVKSSLFRVVFSAFVLVCWCGSASAQEARLGVEQGSVAEQQVRSGGIVTLYALDPLARSFCFHDGREGLMFRNDRVTKRCTSDLGFNPAVGGAFLIGTDANRVGAIVDLGTVDEIRARYGYDGPAGAAIGFASLRLLGEKVFVLVQKEDRPQEKAEPLKEAQALSQVGPGATITLGHIYVLRIADAKDGRPQLLVKVMVIAYAPNETVTLRWEVL